MAASLLPSDRGRHRVLVAGHHVQIVWMATSTRSQPISGPQISMVGFMHASPPLVGPWFLVFRN